MRTSLIAPCLFFFAACYAASSVLPNWPDTPWHTDGRYMKSASGKTVTYAGVNWPGAADAMLPEGLQYASIQSTVSKIKSLGMNVIRLTYAIEMIDDIYANNPNSTLKGTLVNALGEVNGTKVLKEILKHNPQFTEDSTRLDAFDAVAAECAAQEIYVHLDNHVSKAEWCCSHTDGNAWFGDTYFNVANWQRGLKYMANHVKKWEALTSMSLRNELREPTDNATLDATSYNWATWLSNMVPAANGIHAANTLPLIFFSGLNYDTDLANITLGLPVSPDGAHFDKSALAYPKKVVFELHNYDNGATSCANMEGYLGPEGYDAMDLSDKSVLNHAPVVMTEFGFSEDNVTYTGVYSECIKSYLTGMKGGWMVWVLAGSYYIRSGQQDLDESWGLLTHDWQHWRSPDAIKNFFKPMVKATLS